MGILFGFFRVLFHLFLLLSNFLKLFIEKSFLLENALVSILVGWGLIPVAAFSVLVYSSSSHA